MKNLFSRVKPVSELVQEAKAEGHDTLKRTLTAPALVMLGIGAIIGAGLFVQTAKAAAEHAGPSVSIAFVLAAFGCALAGLCYAELSSSLPIAGSAYTYTYATMGELLAWIIGWDLILEYAVGAATVGIAWSEYFNHFLVHIMNFKAIPYEWCHSPMETLNVLNYVPGMDMTALKSALSTDMIANLQSMGSLPLPQENLDKLSPEVLAHVSSHSGIMKIGRASCRERVYAPV